MTALTSLEEYWAEETLTGQGQNQGTQALSNAASAPSSPSPTVPCSVAKFFALVGNVFIFLMVIEVILLLLILYEVMK